MSEGRRRIKRYDVDLTSFLLYLLSFCVTALIFTCFAGADVLFYAWFPLLASALSGAVGHSCVQEFAAEQTLRRMRKGKTADAMVLLRACVILSVLWAVLIAVFFVLLAVPAGKSVLGFSYITPLLYAFAPSAALSWLIGSLTGFLIGIEQKSAARSVFWLETLLRLILGLVCGTFCEVYGQSAGALLRSEDLAAVYCGCGIALGQTLAVCIVLAVLIFLCRLYWQRECRQLTGRDSWLRDSQRAETVPDLLRYMLQRTLPDAAAVLMPFLGLVIAYRFWLTQQSALDTALLTSIWGGIAGIALPLAAAMGLLAFLPLTALTARIVRDQQRAGRRTMQARLSMTLRLAFYAAVPAAAFLSGGAQLIVSSVPGLTFTAEDSAIAALRLSGPAAALLSLLLLTAHLMRGAGHTRELLIASAVGFFSQIVAAVVLNLTVPGVPLCILPLDVYLAAALLTLTLLGRQTFFEGMDAGLSMDFLLILLSAVPAAVLVVLLDNWLLSVLPAAAALAGSILLFAAVYVLLSILLRAADLHSVSRLPGGSFIVSLAVLIGAANREES